MIQAVFFDVGNTLFFYNYDFLKDLLVERFNVDVTTEELEATHQIIRNSIGPMLDQGLTHESIVEEAYRSWFKALGVEQDKIDDIITAIKTHPFRHLFWARTEEGTKELLTWFRDRGYRLGIISNAEGQVKKLVEHVGLSSAFDTILDSHEVGIQKPDERIFKKALEDVGAKPDEAVHVGDLLESDVVGAQAAGITPVLVDKEGRYPDADCIKVCKVSELKDLQIFS